MTAVTKQTPADKVIEAFGGVRKTALAVGRASSSVCRWRMPREKGGLAGRVPSSVQPIIMSLIKAGKLQLTADDLIESA